MNTYNDNTGVVNLPAATNAQALQNFNLTSVIWTSDNFNMDSDSWNTDCSE